MPRAQFAEGLEDQLDAIRLLSSRVDKAVADAMEALRTRDMTLARRVVDGDEEINRLRYDIEEAVIGLIARQTPVASDLRELVSILSIVTELERMGDHAEGIARMALFLEDDPIATTEPELWQMADDAKVMLRHSIQSFLGRDEALARETCDMDDDVDKMYDVVHRQLIGRLAGRAQSAREFDAVTHLLWVSHNLERIADRATNICERAIFLATGRLEEVNVSRY